VVADIETQFVACISNTGRLLLFPVADLPVMARGKGNKMLGIPSAKYKDGSEFCAFVAVLNETSRLTVYAGKRHLTLKPKDLEPFHGERGRRGQLLPRGFRRVDSMVVDLEVKD